MGQALDEHRADIAQLGRVPDLLNGHGGLLVPVFPAEIVLVPDPPAVRLFLPHWVEVEHGVGDITLRVHYRRVMTGSSYEGIKPLPGFGARWL
jgi:hypothetical protein